VQVWEELAQTVRSDLRRGVRVYVEGRRAIRNWTDRENRKHAYREIVASEVRFLDAGPKHEARNSGEFITESSAELQ
jgi:single-stranded DNA-binding protein